MTTAPALPVSKAPSTGRMSADRLRALHAVRRLLAERPEEVHELLCEISTHRAAAYEIDAAVATLDGAEQEIALHRPATVDRLAVFMPSNVILYSYVLYLLIPALYARQLVFRPSSQVKDQMMRLHRMLSEVHGLPVEAAESSQREFLDDLSGRADVVVFTGAYRNAEQVRTRLAPGQLFLFLGSGVNPFVVAPGADLEAAVRDAVEIRLLNSGQDCLGPDLFCVHEDLLEPFTDALRAALDRLRHGPYTDPEADYGPLFYDGALEEAALYLARNRDRIVHGGNVDFRSRRLDPAIVVVPEVTPRTQLPEFFAPVFSIAGYRDERALAATLTTGVFTERALGASVYGSAPELVQALRRRTTVTTDTTLLAIDNGNAPFGGFGRMANYITDGKGMWTEPILVSKAVAEHLPRGRA
ncbi:aldehyde dehydrogenase family protein [Streptomyces sp. R11]|uniref:Aldehyde dehydrogenase family protein n=1 Tax=Streptomyces sp. R11 TaxID=3238625 RepID=A0AB39N3K2_9ACTN